MKKSNFLCSLSLLCFCNLALAEPEASASDAIIFAQPQKKTLYAYFKAPKNWSLSPPSEDRPHVKIAFFENGSKSFKPSINLAQEEVKVNLNDYLKAVKTLHESNPNKKWRKVGKVTTKAGEAVLTQIDMNSEWGVIRMFQAILIKDNVAYVLNAASTKDKIADYYPIFQEAFQSFTLTDDLLSLIEDESKKIKASTFINSFFDDEKSRLINDKEKEKKLDDYLIHELPEYGELWRSLIICEKMNKQKTSTSQVDKINPPI